MGPGEAGGVLGPSLRPGVLGFVDGGTVKTAGRECKLPQAAFFCAGLGLGNYDGPGTLNVNAVFLTVAPVAQVAQQHATGSLGVSYPAIFTEGFGRPPPAAAAAGTAALPMG